MTSTTADNRKFGLLVGGILLLVTAYYSYKGRFMPSILIVAGALMVTALVYPRILNPVQVLWYKAGDILGAINTRVLLFLLYFLLVFPLGLILRLIGKDPLKRNVKKGLPTYWEASPPRQPCSMERQF